MEFWGKCWSKAMEFWGKCSESVLPKPYNTTFFRDWTLWIDRITVTSPGGHLSDSWSFRGLSCSKRRTDSQYKTCWEAKSIFTDTRTHTYLYILYTCIIYIYICVCLFHIYIYACVWVRFIYNLMIISELLSITISFYFKRWIHDAGVCLEDEASTQWQVEVVQVGWQMELSMGTSKFYW